MNFTIEKYFDTKKVCYYTIRFEGIPHSATNLFFEKYNLSHPRDVTHIWTVIQEMGKYGARLERFRVEEDVHALPVTKNGLRLYCIRCSNETVILFDGGCKISQENYYSPEIWPVFQAMKKIERLFRERVKSHEIEYDGRYLIGQLTFSDDIE